ncbi:MAG: PQQ-dependent sugar dehydrogenase [Acidimicrobiia bacterium]|nr:PQQ-dependent sugar dehydrogenase [Acidimicrobiia bacterium]
MGLKRSGVRWLGAVAALALAVAACTQVLTPTAGEPGLLNVDEPGGVTTSVVDATEAPAADTSSAPSESTPPETATDPTTGEPLAEFQGLTLELVTDAVAQPTMVTAPVGDERLFIVERFGRIFVYDPNSGLLDIPFIDLRDSVLANGIEQGLLGLAFHPDYASNGRFFVYHINKSANRALVEYRVSDTDPNRGDPATQKVLVERAQPPDSGDIRHYGGMVEFGPDGLLYVSSGDGADSRGQGQNPDSLFGAIWRIDVDDGDLYAIPADNPFVAGGAPEVWAYGLRNPWRFTIDPVDRLIYIADVGQERWEEIDVASIDTPGINFGWADMEGTHCFFDGECETRTDLALPVLDYSHDEGCSVSGGVVYRGAAIPELNGHYFYGDWCGQWVRSFLLVDGVATAQTEWTLPDPGQVQAIGTDSAGEMYIASFGGTVSKVVAIRDG